MSPEEYARYYESDRSDRGILDGTVINGTDAAASTDNVWHDATIRRFESARAAEATYGQLQGSWSDPVNWSSIEFIDVDFGDESFSLDVEYDQSGVRIYQSIVMVRYDDIILEFGFRAPSPTRDALDSMTDAQIDCFEDEDCLGFSPFTNEVLTLAGLDDPNDDAPAEPEDEDRSDSSRQDRRHLPIVRRRSIEGSGRLDATGAGRANARDPHRSGPLRSGAWSPFPDSI
ncbi:MAG: hypothetical protein R2845_07425 [Thermomicrobiales bacterium]